jgi:thiamine biosynthesis lipoprotein
MKQTRDIMGMPITVEISGPAATEDAFNKVFSYFTYVDEKFSTYKDTSEISKINRGELPWEEISRDMQMVFRLSRETKQTTDGYFDILTPQGTYDPSGLVKGWAIFQAALILKQEGFNKFFIEAGGDIQAQSSNVGNAPWTVGIKNPFNSTEVVKILQIKNEGVATSGTYIRGQHIYNPLRENQIITDIVSLTVIGPNIYEADRFATAAFAMNKDGINFIERMPRLEGYMIDKDGIATMTSGFGEYVAN